MADSDARARAIAGAKERARERNRESEEQTDNATIVSATAVAAEAVPAEPATGAARPDQLTPLEEAMAAELAASRTVDRVPGFESPAVELAGELDVTQSDSDAAAGPGLTGSATDTMPGADREQQIADMRQDHFDSSQSSGTTSPEAAQAVDTFNSVSAALLSGQRPDVGGGLDMDDMLRPGVGPDEQGDSLPSPSSMASGGVVSNAKTDLDLGMTLASTAVGTASGPAGAVLGVSYGVTRYVDEKTGMGDAMVDYALGERVETEGEFGESESAPPSASSTPSSPGVPNPDDSLLGDDPVHSPVPSRAEEEIKARAEAARKQAEEAQKKAEAEAAAKAAEEAAKEAEEQTKTEGAEDQTQPPDDFVDPEEAMALREYLNRMTGYGDAKSIPGDIDPNEHDTGEPSGATAETTKYNDLKGDNRHVEGGTAGAIVGTLGPAGNINGNVMPTDENGATNFAGGFDQETPDLSGPGQTMVNPFAEEETDTARWSPDVSDQPLFSFSRETDGPRAGESDADNDIDG